MQAMRYKPQATMNGEMQVAIKWRDFSVTQGFARSNSYAHTLPNIDDLSPPNIGRVSRPLHTYDQPFTRHVRRTTSPFYAARTHRRAAPLVRRRGDMHSTRID